MAVLPAPLPDGTDERRKSALITKILPLIGSPSAAPIVISVTVRAVPAAYYTPEETEGGATGSRSYPIVG